MPVLFTGHELFDLARSICGRRPRFDEHTWEEAVAETVLALLEKRDPHEAARKAFRKERTWRVQHPPIYENADVTSDGRLVIIGPHD